MTTEFSIGKIPAFYREVFEACSTNGDPVHRDVFQELLNISKLENSALKSIWELTGPSQGLITRTNLYKCLAFIAWAQEGKTPSNKLLELFSGKEYPVPELGDITAVKTLKSRLNSPSNLAEWEITYSDIKQLDTISIELDPEKKGLILKYSEYIVSSRRFSSRVTRRYNDFVALYDLLLGRFPYRVIPRLPPKKIVSDAHFLETRRRALQRWLTLVCCHPTVGHDALVSFFLTEQGSDIQHRIRNIFRRDPDEFMTSNVAATAKTLLPGDCSEFANNREQVRLLVQVVSRLKQLTDASVERSQEYSRDSEDLANQLKALGQISLGSLSNDHWRYVQKGFTQLANKVLSVPVCINRHTNTEQASVCGRLDLLLDVLIAHRDLCKRLEKGLAQDHQAALAKLLSLKKRKIQGVIKGADNESVEQLESRVLAQENIISNMELRSDFSLYCVHMETQLVHVYLQTLSSTISSLVFMHTQSHSELADVWNHILSTVKKGVPEEASAANCINK